MPHWSRTLVRFTAPLLVTLFFIVLSYVAFGQNSATIANPGGHALVTPAVSHAVSAPDDHPHRYYDKQYKDWHNWNEQENRSYRHWLEERHENYRDFAKQRSSRQRDYWKWRHDHPGEVR